MRESCAWFSDRAQKTWRAEAGRSFLVVAPQGCNEHVARKLVSEWCLTNFSPPSPYKDFKPLTIELVSDELSNSRQFALRVASLVSQRCELKVAGVADEGDYPSDIILNSFETALSEGLYPILFVSRFHAFASIQDGGMSSVLSQLRTLEMDKKLTTIAFSAMPYDAIRKSMSGSHAFLNSVYGDGHDQVVLDPISRDEFVRHCTGLGILACRAHETFKLAGGPDSVFYALCDAVLTEQEDIISFCSEKCESSLSIFFSRSFSEAGDSIHELLSSLVVGQLRLEEESFIRSSPFIKFFAKERADGRLGVSSPVISRWILRKMSGKSRAYGHCLELLRAGERRRGLDSAENLPDINQRSAAFKAVAKLYSCLLVDEDLSFFGVDWAQLHAAAKKAKLLEKQIPISFSIWVDLLFQWTARVNNLRLERMRADSLARYAADSQIRKFLLLLVCRYLDHALKAPRYNLAGLVNLPELILQVLASGFLSLDFHCAPSGYEAADYQEFFSGKSEFAFPSEGSKISLTSLVVIVPTILKKRGLLGDYKIIDKEYIRGIQGKLVERIRNPSAHTILELTHTDLGVLAEVCSSFLEAWLSLECYSNFEAASDDWGFPTIDSIEDLLVA